MNPDMKKFVDYVSTIGIEDVAHTGGTYLAHLANVYHLMESNSCTPELCRAGMFHSIYGTQMFQGFKLTLEKRPEVRDLIGERAEWLAYLNCAIDRPSLDAAVERAAEPYHVTDRLTGEVVALSRADFDDLCRV